MLFQFFMILKVHSYMACDWSALVGGDNEEIVAVIDLFDHKGKLFGIVWVLVSEILFVQIPLMLDRFQNADGAWQHILS